MSRILGTLVGVVLVLLCIGGPVAFAVHMQAQRKTSASSRTACCTAAAKPTLFGLKNLLHEYGIRTVVTLRSLREERAIREQDKAEEDYCRWRRRSTISVFRRPHWESAEGPPPGGTEHRRSSGR